LLQSTPIDVLWATGSAALALVALAGAATGWMRGALTPVDRVVAAVAAVLLFIPRGVSTIAGAALLAVVIARQWKKSVGSRELGVGGF
jgi:TRAP-type uncharacterized transport system fused permease subunit